MQYKEHYSCFASQGNCEEWCWYSKPNYWTVYFKHLCPIDI